MPTSKLSEYRRKRNFRRTSEPSGAEAKSAPGASQFVIQKHAASHLHYDLRLEAGGVMKSWAVPKGPSLDPTVKRLAVEVEDHPMQYNTFEGTIPAGEYGGGTVMLWDRGTYVPVEGGRAQAGARARAGPGEGGEGAERIFLKGYKAGKIDLEFFGERLRGRFTLVRTSGARGRGKPQWLLMKKRDEHASRSRDIAEEVRTSVATGRTMEEIAEGRGGSRVWRSNRGGTTKKTKARRTSSKRIDPSTFAPMLATTADGLPAGDDWTFEPKYDGIRVLAFATESAAALITRNGNEKSAQFPEIVDALRELAEAHGDPLVLDGEIVPLVDGSLGRFEALQARMHVQSRAAIRAHVAQTPVAFVAFDLLLDDGEAFLDEPWMERRARLEAVLEPHTSERVRLTETTSDGEDLLQRARREGWEGIIAKRTDAGYAIGKRSRDWQKVKVEGRQEFVVGGWTEPRRSRQHIGALLLGYYDGDEFVYAGHTGTGFTDAGLRDMGKRLAPLERETSPFAKRPRTNERAHWVQPRVVVEVKFNEWTREGKLRQPVFLGVRDDKDPSEVVKETGEAKAKGKGRVKGEGGGKARKPKGGEKEVVAGITLTNFSKVWFPKEKITKGDVLEYYQEMSKVILPAMKDRPLVLKRFPDGIEGESFYQQAPGDRWPEGVRVEEVPSDSGPQKRLIGGNLATLLYTIQLGAISYDPWHSRIGKLEYADYSVIDLDPQPGASFRKVVKVAGYVKEALDEAGLEAALKTSGSRGLHVYVPLPARTPWEAGTLIAQIIATRVAEQHRKDATVVRAVRKRPHGTVYVDYLQNILGKTIAGVYAVRAKPGGTVSTPLRWDELTPDLDAREFTLRSVPDRVREIGDLWASQMKRRNSLQRLLPREKRGAAKKK